MLFPCDGMDISVNAVSGALQGYHRLGPRPYVVESHDAKLTFDQAEAVAKQIVSKCSVGVWRPADGDLRPQVGPPPAAAPSFLAYVTPNGTFSAPNYTDKPVRLRLAWVLCYPRSDEIWIDAADGKVLGGAYDSTKG